MAGSPVPEGNSLSPDIKVVRNLWQYLWPKENNNIRWRFIIAITAMLAAKIASTSVPLFFKIAVNDLSLYTSPLVIGATIPVFIILGYGFARLLCAALNEVRDGVFATVTQQAVRHVSLRVFHHLHQLGLRFHLDRQTGGLSRSIERGTKGIESLLQFLTWNIIPTTVEILMVGVLIWVLYDYRFAVIILSTMIGYIAFTLAVTEWRIHFVRTMNETDNEANSKAVDSLLNFETVKYFNNENYEANRFDSALKKYKTAAIKSKLSLSFLNIGQAIILTLGLTSVMYLTALDIEKGLLTVGDFVALNAYIAQLYVPLFTLGFAYREVKISLVNMDQMFALLNIPQEICDLSDAPSLNFQKGEIVFENVHFSYNPDRLILQGISFTIPAGKTLAIVGPSGAGKSTLSRLLFRFYDVISGRILIDGQDIQHITQESLRRLIGIVPQDTVLFNDTIGYNIAYGNPTASAQDVVKAAQDAQIHDFIISLPEGYESRVGERGLKLSGGEKQRVAIARTLLKKPEIFLFDEATSSLDTRTEKQIQSRLLALSRNHTTLIIAHRLSTVVDADQIIVLHQGQIAEQGTHNDLLQQHGLYKSMWEQQQSEQNASLENIRT